MQVGGHFGGPSQPGCPDTSATIIVPSVEALDMRTSLHPDTAACVAQKYFPKGKQPRSYESIWDACQGLVSIGKAVTLPGQWTASTALGFFL